MQIKKISIKEVISKETCEALRSMADDMCGLVSNLNSQNYETFIRTRDSYVKRLNNLTLYANNDKHSDE